MSTPVRFALIGNPNCGKTSLFNLLTGARAKVANYPGVTVERRLGMLSDSNKPVEIVDLPGTYSLYVTSPDEQVARDVILGNRDGEKTPDILIAVVDACNLRLGLCLVMELRALNRPMILAINQMDEATRRGFDIDTQGLAASLGTPVVESAAINNAGTAALREQIKLLAAEFQPEDGAQPLILEDRKATVEELYRDIDTLLATHVKRPAIRQAWQDKLDALVMHPVLGLGFLFVLLLVIFQAVFAWASPFIDLIDAGFSALGEVIGNVLPDGILKDFIVDGLIAGVGGVLVFLPQILILFFFILSLEDSGYLTRAAFLLDRPMRGMGLSGRAFIPMLSSFACAVPGIMATRTIADPRERYITIMVAPLMTCSARLPVYALIIAAFIPQQTVWGIFNLQGLTLFGLYLAGILSAAFIAWMMRRRSTRNEYPLLLELPSYRIPNPYQLYLGMRERTWIFVRRVGTIILALSIVLWFLATFPGAPDDATLPAIDYSFAGQLGHVLQPIFEPLGFSWQMVIALIPAMGAREVAVSALAMVYAIGEESIDAALGATLAASWSLPVAFAYLAWFVYAPQCISTIAVVKRETNSTKATVIFTLYLFALAYAAAWITYHIAKAIVG
jgi:ferrous iron transport protein B